MPKLKKLTNLNLIWINRQGFWVYQCSTCQQTKLERKETKC